jgi:hypothetical protein
MQKIKNIKIKEKTTDTNRIFSSSLSSLVNPFTPEGRAIKEAKEAQNPSYR